VFIDGIIIVMVERKGKNKNKKKQKRATPVGRTDEPSTASSSTIIDPTPLDDKEESQLKEAIQKAMLDEKGQDKGYFTIEDVSSLLTTLPQTHWTESKVERVVAEWYDKAKLKDQQGIGKYRPA
jgi:hypothetical protein